MDNQNPIENKYPFNGQNGRYPYDFEDDEINLKDFLPVLWRGKWIILLVTVAVFNLALLYTMRVEPEYEATVTLFVNTQGQTASLLRGFAFEETKKIGNEVELLKSRMIAEAVTARLIEQRFLDEDLPDPIPILMHFDPETDENVWSTPGQVTARLRRTVTFDTRRDSDFINITARTNNSEEAVLIANTYAQVYYDRNFYRSRQQSRTVREFLEEQLDTRREQLLTAEEAFRNYMEEQGVVQIDNETSRVIDQIAELEAQREATAVEIQSLTSTLASLQSQLEEQEPNVARNISSADNPYIRMIQEQMAQLEVERDLTVTQNPGAEEDERYRRMLSDIDEQLGILRQNLRRRTAEFMETMAPSIGDDPAGYVKQLRQRLLETDIELQGLEYRRLAINESLARYESQFERLPQVAMEYASLQRARTSSEKLYLMLEERYNEALITEQSQFGSVDIIDRALVPERPVSPNVRLNLLLGLLLGGGLGVGFVIGRERLYAPVRTPEEIMKNGYDTLTTVASMNSEIKRLAPAGRIKQNKKDLDAHLIMLTNPLSPTAESYRLLRTNLQYAQVDKKIRTLLVTSANRGEGKSTTIANLAISYAQAGENTLLIDCDMRKPALADELDQLSKPGLTEVLADEMSFNDAVQKTAVDHLDFLACGTLPANPAELVGSKKMKKLLDTLSGRYRIILLDSPPVLAASDPLVLSTLTDSVVLVVASNRTKMKELDLTRSSLTRVGSRITGVVINFFDQRDAYGSAYSYKYYKYGSYGYSSYGGENGVERKHVKVD